MIRLGLSYFEFPHQQDNNSSEMCFLGKTRNTGKEERSSMEEGKHPVKAQDETTYHSLITWENSAQIFAAKGRGQLDRFSVVPQQSRVGRCWPAAWEQNSLPRFQQRLRGRAVQTPAAASPQAQTQHAGYKGYGQATTGICYCHVLL